ncbi:hypothetical protein GCM10010885_18310 [Alicyclobacillus cellulosilyticus]|uniref:Type IV pilus assembly protein PilO n=1 Tax=Alicyclobacillus cellulosilyticus TaxID=1003997 RepID=A0A917KF51_9BACL|nr:hypothetical protein [Alicyclobacillus cellulosilyticus]GGJ09527.1 hypothetical protein GCM10010885_18310 [Alicyclobacillus cellulosilyticus]
MFDIGKMQWRTYKWEITAMVVLLAIAGALYGLDVQSRGQLRSLREQVQAQALQIQQAEAALRNQAAWTQEAAGKKLDAILPPSLDIASILMEQAAVAKQAGVTVTSFQFTPEPLQQAGNTGESDVVTNGTSGIAAYPVTVTVAGPVTRILAFIRALSTYPRLTTVEQVNWEVYDPHGSSSAQVVYDVYTAGP